MPKSATCSRGLEIAYLGLSVLETCSSFEFSCIRLPTYIPKKYATQMISIDWSEFLSTSFRSNLPMSKKNTDWESLVLLTKWYLFATAVCIGNYSTRKFAWSLDSIRKLDPGFEKKMRSNMVPGFKAKKNCKSPPPPRMRCILNLKTQTCDHVCTHP